MEYIVPCKIYAMLTHIELPFDSSLLIKLRYIDLKLLEIDWCMHIYRAGEHFPSVEYSRFN